MKINIIAVLLVNLLLISACDLDSRTNAKSTDNALSNENQNASAVMPVVNASQPSRNSNTVKIESAQTLVWIGGISADELKTSKENSSVWNNDLIGARQENDQVAEVVEVDLMNCAGFLITGKLTDNYDGGWKLETIPETAAPDAADKIKRCTDDSGTVGADAFAVAPRDEKRRNIKIGEADTRNLYASLPREERKWLEEKKKVYQTGSGFERKEKKNLTLRNDNWTDIDGNGEIDLVMISAACERDDTEGDLCGRILLKINGKWKEIGST